MTTPEDHLKARNRAAHALRELSHMMIAREMEVELLEEIERNATQLLTQAKASPEKTHPFRTVHSFSMPVPSGEGEKPTHLFADSIVSGTANPMSMNATLWKEEAQAMMSVTLGAAHEGAPGRAHGGLVAALIVETMGLVLGIIGTPAFTGRLTVTYRAPTPLGVELTGRAWMVEHRGRKITMAAEIRAGEELIAEGDALFITVNTEQFISAAEGIIESS